MNEILKKSADLMLSSDYKERFLAEYMQIKNRYEGLSRMIENWDNRTLSFTPTCPRETYNFQLRAMKDYMDILIVRASMEKINLNY